MSALLHSLCLGWMPQLYNLPPCIFVNRLPPPCLYNELGNMPPGERAAAAVGEACKGRGRGGWLQPPGFNLQIPPSQQHASRGVVLLWGGYHRWGAGGAGDDGLAAAPITCPPSPVVRGAPLCLDSSHTHNIAGCEMRVISCKHSARASPCGKPMQPSSSQTGSPAPALHLPPHYQHREATPRSLQAALSLSPGERLQTLSYAPRKLVLTKEYEVRAGRALRPLRQNCQVRAVWLKALLNPHPITLRECAACCPPRGRVACGMAQKP